MKNQKICIIGGGLAGLTTAIALSKLGCQIDLITSNQGMNIKMSNRTTAISENNYNFLKKLDISKNLQKDMWASSKMKLYTENSKKEVSEIFELDNERKNKNVLYMFENSKIIKHMINKIKKIKNINVIQNKKISEIKDEGLLKSIKLNNYNFKYNLIIICAGSNSILTKKLFKDQEIHSPYNELSFTTILKHSYLKNNITRQLFLDDEILALLPLSNTKTSIVWSIKKHMKPNNKVLKKKIKFFGNIFLKKIVFSNSIEYKDLNFLLRKKYYRDRILLFGDALHVIHPFVGQGFNMILRDLISLSKILKSKINLGLDIGSPDILSEFTNETKSHNFAFAISTDIIKNSFSIKNSYYKKIRNDLFKNINRNNFVKDIFFNIADKGLKF